MGMTLGNTVDGAVALDDGAGVSIISSLVSGPVTLGSGGYADGLTITSTGTVSGAYGGDIVGNGTVVNYGVLEYVGISGGGIGLSSGTIINRGNIIGNSELGYGTLVNSGTILAQGFLIKNGLVIDSGIIQDGEFAAAYGLTLVLEPGFGGGEPGFAGLADVSSENGTLIPAAGLQDISLYGFGGFSKIDVGDDLGITLNANFGWLEGIQTDEPTLSGFQSGDTLFVAVAASYVSGVGIVAAIGDGLTATIALGSLPVGGLEFTSINSTSTGPYVEITAACFCAGTRICTPSGELPVEALAIGDEVVTAFAGARKVKWIGRRSYEGRFITDNLLALPVCIKAGAMDEGVPERDLWVSPDHGICEGGVLVHAWRLVNGASIVQAEAVERVEYFHVELEGHHVLFAEGCPAESFLDTGCRTRFANAGEYAGLYGEEERGKVCLPLVESGFHLENIRRRLAERAGVVAPVLAPGPLRGCLDEAGPERLRGWAQDVAAPEAPVVLRIVADGKPFGLVLANAFRADLRSAGIGSGCHGFDVPFLGGVKKVTVYRASDGAALEAGGPVTLNGEFGSSGAGSCVPAVHDGPELAAA